MPDELKIMEVGRKYNSLTMGPPHIPHTAPPPSTPWLGRCPWPMAHERCSGHAPTPLSLTPSARLMSCSSLSRRSPPSRAPHHTQSHNALTPPYLLDNLTSSTSTYLISQHTHTRTEQSSLKHTHKHISSTSLTTSTFPHGLGTHPSTQTSFPPSSSPLHSPGYPPEVAFPHLTTSPSSNLLSRST